MSCDFREVAIQIQGSDSDPIATHPVGVVWQNRFIGLSIQEQTRNLVGLISELGIFVFHISEDLIKVVGMNGVSIILHLCCVRIVFGIDDQNMIPCRQGDVALHDR